MAEPLLSVERVSCRFGGLLAVNAVSLTVAVGRITGLIGPNGAGKTTLFAIISGFQRPSDGIVCYRGETITGLPPYELARRGIARTFQIVQPFTGLSVRENILVALTHGRASVTPPTMAELLEEYRLGGVADRPAADLNSAQQKMLDLTRALATRPRLLLLDELAAGLNPAELDWIAGRIKALAAEGMAIIVVEHLMGFIEQITDRVIVLNAGKEIFEGTLAAAVREPQVIEVFLGGEHAA